MPKKLNMITFVVLMLATPAMAETMVRFDYRDDQDRKRNAEVRAEVDLDAAGTGALRLTFSARAPFIDPQPGFAGLRGMNKHTAFQLGELVEMPGRFYMVTYDLAGRFVAGHAESLERVGGFYQRARNSDGSLNFYHRMPEPVVLEVTCETRGLAPGYYTSYVWANGEPRLKVSYQITAEEGRVLSVKSLAHQPPGQTLNTPYQVYSANPVTAFTSVGTQTSEDTAKPVVKSAAWAALDHEGKWEYYRASMEKDPGSGTRWVNTLVEWKDYAFLEMIALYEVDAYQTFKIGELLKSAKAPQWIRLAIWMQKSKRGHMSFATQKLLHAEDSKNDVLSWLNAYPEIRDDPGHQTLLDGLKKLDASDLEAGGLLPPLKAKEVFRDLDGKASRIRTERAIQGLIVSGRYEEPWLGKLADLTRHEDQLVRQAAYLAYASLGPKRVPTERFRKVVEDVNEPDLIREAALMAFSYGPDYEVYPYLHLLAKRPGHPVWQAAVSRLGDLGDGFTLAMLEGLELEQESEKAFLSREMKRIQERVTVPTAKQVSTRVSRWFKRVAWAELEGYELYGALKAWTLDQVQPHLEDPGLQKSIESLRQKSEAAASLPEGRERDLLRQMRTTFDELEKMSR